MKQVYILLPIYKPNLDWLSEQIDSIATQTYTEFICIVSHDGGVSELQREKIVQTFPDDRFVYTSSKNRLGTYRHIERLISEYGFRADFFALSDQDDVWKPQKIQRKMEYFADPEVCAVSANAFIIDEKLEKISRKTCFEWFGIKGKETPYSLLLNQLTGASAIFRSAKFVGCLPFPANLGSAVHDHWLYITAISNGSIKFEVEPLWLYRQHKDNQIGASAGRWTFIRVLKGMRKAASIVMKRVSAKEDVVIQQGRIFHKEVCRRWPEKAPVDDLFASQIGFKRRIMLMSPREVFQSNIESLRVALSRSPKR